MTDTVFRTPAAQEKALAEYRRVVDEWPVASTARQIETREGQTFVLAWGQEEAPPVVLLHGAQANSAAWLPDVSLWAERFRLYGIDMIGEPGFSAPVRPRLDGERHALWLDDVMAGLGLAHAAIVGTSLGGWLALDYARHRPAFVDALALICPAGIGRQRNFLLKALPLMLLGPWGQRRVVEMVFGPAPVQPDESVRPWAELMQMAAQATRPRTMQIPRLSDAELHRLGMPLLAIVGGRDVLLDSHDTRRRLEREAPHAEICFIEDGFHYLPGHAERVMDFLERSLGAAPADHSAP